MPRCRATKRSGEPCRISVELGVEFCWAHDPANREQRQRITSRAGKSKPNKELLSIKERLSTLADGVLDGSTDKAVGAVASQILNVLLRAITVELQVRDHQEFVQRLESLEESMARRKPTSSTCSISPASTAPASRLSMTAAPARSSIAR